MYVNALKRIILERVCAPDINDDALESYHWSKKEDSVMRRPSPCDSMGMMAVDPITEDLAIRIAEEQKTSLPQSLVVEAHRSQDCVVPFQREEVALGLKLGTGEFSDVYEVRSFNLKQVSAADTTRLSSKEIDQRTYMKAHERYRNTASARYAVKHIKDDYYLNHKPESFIQAVSDLALEAELLSYFQHPHIIKLRGIASAGPSGFKKDGPAGGFFLVIDRLFDTLDEKIAKWSVKSSRIRSYGLSSLPLVASAKKAKATRKKLLDERLSIAIQISSAMVYLHKHSIIFRDLKPQNIGFDVRGDVKIFDFGLARIMPQDGDQNNDVWEMSGAGSPRYMSPECLAAYPYNLKADVYSFAIIVWEMLTGQVPYGFVKNKLDLFTHVVEKQRRPSIDQRWPQSIKDMLESSFNADIGWRPEMPMWYNSIRETLVHHRKGDSSGLNDAMVSRRRSLDSV